MMIHSYWGSIISRWLPWLEPKDGTTSINGSIASPSFTGSKNSVERYLGPTLQKLVEETSVKHPRRCQRCKSSHIDPTRRKEVDAKAVITAALEFHKQGDTYFVNLEQLEQHIHDLYKEQVEAHPILCKECLRKRQVSMGRESYKFPDLSVYKTPELKLGPNLVTSGASENLRRVKEELEKISFSAAEFATFKNMKIGKLVCHTLPRIIKNNGLSERVISKLQDKDYSKLIFDVNYPILKKLNSRYSSDDLWKDENGYSRYYSLPVKWKGSEYLITSQWYEGSHELYLKWLRRKVEVI